MITALPKLKEALSKRVGDSSPANSNAASSSTESKRPLARKIGRQDLEKLADGSSIDAANIKFEGDPDDQVIVFDLDETLIAGDKHPIDKKREAQINAMGDRKVETVPKDHPLNKRGREIKYVLRPGVKELMEYLHSRGYKMIACTRNYTDRGESICDHDPVLKKYLSGCLGRSDLMSDMNKDFKKFPNHCDKISFAKKVKGFFHTAFVYTPKYLWLKFKSIFNGKNIRFNPEVGKLGKYPPNMLELLAAKGNNKLQGLRPPRMLVDNSAIREDRDSKQSGDWAFVDCNVDRNGDGKATPFMATDEAPTIELEDPSTGEKTQGYEWVKKTITEIEKGWKEVYKESTGKEPKAI